jgi:hypothetical protein
VGGSESPSPTPPSFMVPQNEAGASRAKTRIVVILADNVRNYLSKFINEEWMKEKGLEG